MKLEFGLIVCLYGMDQLLLNTFLNQSVPTAGTLYAFKLSVNSSTRSGKTSSNFLRVLILLLILGNLNVVNRGLYLKREYRGFESGIVGQCVDFCFSIDG